MENEIIQRVIKCNAKDCNIKIVINFRTVIIDDKKELESLEMFPLCEVHKKQLNDTLVRIKNHFTDDELKEKIAKDIATNVAEAFIKKKN